MWDKFLQKGAIFRRFSYSNILKPSQNPAEKMKPWHQVLPYVTSKAQPGLPSASHVCWLNANGKFQDQFIVCNRVTLSPARKEEMLLSESCPYHTNQDPCNYRKNLPCHDLSLITFISTSHVRLFQILQATPEDHSKALALSPNVSVVAGIVFLEPNGKWQRTVDHSQARKTRKRTSITSITEACFPTMSCMRSYSSRIPYCWSKLPISSSCSWIQLKLA